MRTLDGPENSICTIPTHTATGELYVEVGYAYFPCRSCMRRQGTHRAPTGAVCVPTNVAIFTRLFTRLQRPIFKGAPFSNKLHVTFKIFCDGVKMTLLKAGDSFAHLTLT